MSDSISIEEVAPVQALEVDISQSALLFERVSRVEEKVSALKESSLRIERKLDALGSKR